MLFFNTEFGTISQSPGFKPDTVSQSPGFKLGTAIQSPGFKPGTDAIHLPYFQTQTFKSFKKYQTNQQSYQQRTT